MEALQITRQMINFNKAVFHNSYVGMTVMQNYSENVVDGLLRQYPWVTEENKKPFKDSLHYIKQTQEQFKEAVERSFTIFEEMIEKNNLRS